LILLAAMAALGSSNCLAQSSVAVRALPDGSIQVDCYDIQAARSIACSDAEIAVQTAGSIANAFQSRRFEQLDRQYARWCTGADRFANGRWKLESVSLGLDNAFRQGAGAFLKSVQAWQAFEPDAELPRLAEALYWRDAAWSLRRYADAGEGASKEVMQLFDDRLRRSDAVLTRLMTSQSRCPAVDVLSLAVMIDGNAAPDKLQAAYQAAVARTPEYQAIHFAMARRFDPARGGRARDYNAFAELAANLSREFEGSGMYARLFALVDTANGIEFRESSGRPPDWGQLQASYDDLLERYPDSIELLASYASVTCRTGDSERYRRLRARLVGYAFVEGAPDPLEVCDRRHHWAPTPH
jgi:hypothetical protein